MFVRPVFARPVRNDDLVKFKTTVQGMQTDHYTKNFPLSYAQHTPVIDFTTGRKFARVHRQERGSRNVYCFIDLSNGDILKSASWKAPAKHPRGNIFNDNSLQGCTVYGAEYLA